MYLTGIGAGAAAGSLVVRRSRSPSRTFLIVQAAIGVYVALAIAIIVALFGHAQAPGWLQEYVARYEPLDVRASVRALVLYFRASGDLPRQFLALYLVLPALLVGPPTVLMGVSFPLLQQAVQTDLARIGHRVGTLLAANIVGSTIGSLATGWILLGRLGTSGTLKLLIAASAIFPLWGVVRPIVRQQPAPVARPARPSSRRPRSSLLSYRTVGHCGRACTAARRGTSSSARTARARQCCAARLTSSAASSSS